MSGVYDGKVKVRVCSARWVNTPVVVDYAQFMFDTGTKKDKTQAVTIIMATMNMSPEENVSMVEPIRNVLENKRHEVEDETFVVFEVDVPEGVATPWAMAAKA